MIAFAEQTTTNYQPLAAGWSISLCHNQKPIVPFVAADIVPDGCDGERQFFKFGSDRHEFTADRDVVGKPEQIAVALDGLLLGFVVVRWENAEYAPPSLARGERLFVHTDGMRLFG